MIKHVFRVDENDYGNWHVCDDSRGDGKWIFLCGEGVEEHLGVEFQGSYEPGDLGEPQVIPEDSKRSGKLTMSDASLENSSCFEIYGYTLWDGDEVVDIGDAAVHALKRLFPWADRLWVKMVVRNDSQA